VQPRRRRAVAGPSVASRPRLLSAATQSVVHDHGAKGALHARAVEPRTVEGKGRTWDPHWSRMLLVDPVPRPATFALKRAWRTEGVRDVRSTVIGNKACWPKDRPLRRVTLHEVVKFSW